MSGSHGVKVVIIHTQYVQTDPSSFKSVVQKLTGKDLKASDSFDNGSVTRKGHKGTRREWTTTAEMLRNLSFKGLDRLMKEMPTMEEMDDYIGSGQ